MNHPAPMSEIEEIQYEYWTNEDSCSGMNSSASSTGVLQVFLLSNDENYKSEYKTVAGARCEEWMLASASADCIWILFYSFVILCLVKLIINFTFALFTLLYHHLVLTLLHLGMNVTQKVWLRTIVI